MLEHDALHSPVPLLRVVLGLLHNFHKTLHLIPGDQLVRRYVRKARAPSEAGFSGPEGFKPVLGHLPPTRSVLHYLPPDSYSFAGPAQIRGRGPQHIGPPRKRFLGVLLQESMDLLVRTGHRVGFQHLGDGGGLMYPIVGRQGLQRGESGPHSLAVVSEVVKSGQFNQGVHVVRFDGQHVLFSYRPGEDGYYHIFEMNVDGSELRQLTDGNCNDVDPHYLPDGRIALFNNNSFRSKQSQVLVVDPATGQTAPWFEGREPEFFTKWMGKVQVLPGGNALVTIPGEGRVIQATRDGEIVFEYVNVINEKSNGHVENAIWLPADFFTNPPHCPTGPTSGGQRSRK